MSCDVYRFLATGAETGGKYATLEVTGSPGGGPPPHIDRREVEAFYVLEGEGAFFINGERLLAPAGTFANMPIGSLHTFRTESDRPAKMLVTIAPAGLEAMFLQCGSPLEEGAVMAPPRRLKKSQSSSPPRRNLAWSYNFRPTTRRTRPSRRQPALR